MKVRPNREMKNLVADIKRAEEFLNEGKLNEAHEILMRARGIARTQGLPYGRIAWNLCICLDYQGRVEEALRMAVEALDQDPLAPGVRSSFLIVSKRLREIVAAAEVGDPATPVHYALLAQNDAAESDTHVAMARHLLAAGDASAAEELLESVTTLAPNCGSAWRLRADLARSQSREEEAGQYEFEALAIENAIESAVHTTAHGS